MRWESDVQLDGAAESHIPVSLVIAAVSDHHPSEPLLLVQATEHLGAQRIDGMRETLVAVRR